MSTSNASSTRNTSSIRESLPQIFAVFIKNIIAIGFGMAVGYPTILISNLSTKRHPDEPLRLTNVEISWISCMNFICIPIGCVLSGWLAEKLGRKRVMQIFNVPLFATWVAFKYAREVWQILVALGSSGLILGFLEAPVLAYVAEITEPKLRGILASTSTVSSLIGVLLVFLMGTKLQWRAVASVSCIVPVLAFILLFLIPESPVWLVNVGRFQEAKNSLAWLRGKSSLEGVDPEFKSLCKKLGKTKDVWITNPQFIKESNGKRINLKSTTWFRENPYFKKNFLLPFCLVGFTFFLRHFSGMTILQTYSVEIFTTFHVPLNKYNATVFLGIAEVLGCLVGTITIRMIGKRLLNILSIFCFGICFILIGSYSFINGITHLHIENIHSHSHNLKISSGFNYKWFPLATLITSAFLSHVGLRILPSILTGEVYSNETRSLGAGLSSGLGYIFGFLSNKLFLSMASTLTVPGLFWFCAGISLTGNIVLYCILPETEGRSLEEITDHFAGIRPLDTKVQRNKNISNENDFCYVQVTEED